jgi:hypothetical protein
MERRNTESSQYRTIQKIKNEKKKRIQRCCKKIVSRIVKPQRGFCEIDADKIADHYAENFETTLTYNKDEETLFIKDKKENNLKITEEDAKSYLYHHDAINNILRYKGLLSALGNDILTYGILKADRDGCSRVIRYIIRAMLYT